LDLSGLRLATMMNRAFEAGLCRVSKIFFVRATVPDAVTIGNQPGAVKH
jgi:hypothetical protein